MTTDYETERQWRKQVYNYMHESAWNEFGGLADPKHIEQLLLQSYRKMVREGSRLKPYKHQKQELNREHAYSVYEECLKTVPDLYDIRYKLDSMDTNTVFKYKEPEKPRTGKIFGRNKHLYKAAKLRAMPDNQDSK